MKQTWLELCMLIDLEGFFVDNSIQARRPQRFRLDNYSLYRRYSILRANILYHHDIVAVSLDHSPALLHWSTSCIISRQLLVSTQSKKAFMISKVVLLCATCHTNSRLKASTHKTPQQLVSSIRSHTMLPDCELEPTMRRLFIWMCDEDSVGGGGVHLL